MINYICKTRCQFNNRVYEPGETVSLLNKQKPSKHFERITEVQSEEMPSTPKKGK